MTDIPVSMRERAENARRIANAISNPDWVDDLNGNLQKVVTALIDLERRVAALEALAEAPVVTAELRTTPWWTRLVGVAR